MSEQDQQSIRTFLSEFTCVVDAQRRLALPKLWRLDSDTENTRFLISPGPGPSINFHTFDHFQELLRRAMSAPEDEESQNYLTQTAAYSSVVTLDKQGRFSLTPQLMEYAGIKDKVICVGVWTYGRIMSPENYAANKVPLSQSISYQSSLKPKATITETKVSVTETL